MYKGVLATCIGKRGQPLPPAMGEAANVFNSFSFGKWADLKKEEELDKESRRRRNAQIKRLKEQLAEERRLRERGGSGDGDLDLEALIEALQRGEEINEDDYDEPELDEYGERTDDDILSEIREYQKHHFEPPGRAHGADERFWKFNRRFGETTPAPRPVSARSWKYNRAPEEKPHPREPVPPTLPPSPKEQFKYNRVANR